MDTLSLSHSVKDQPAPSAQYILQECSQLRDEIWTRVEDQRATERYMLLACAVIYSFLALPRSDATSEEIRILTAFGWYVPPLLAFLAASRWCENVGLIHRIAAYTKMREAQILGPEGGWETYLTKRNGRWGPSVLLSGHYVAFWLFLIFSTMTVAAYQHSGYLTTWRLSGALLAGVVSALATFSMMVGPGIAVLSNVQGSLRQSPQP